nr:MAG TPA: hypothetical protein [Caudoviricetes sp.]
MIIFPLPNTDILTVSADFTKDTSLTKCPGNLPNA